MQISSKVTIGIVEYISLSGIGTDIPAKIDTGADSSSIWATDISIGPNGALRFVLFAEGFEWYTGKVIETSDFTVAKIKNSTGQSEVRYRTRLTVSLAGKKIKALFNLSDRSNNTYKVLIGRRTISGKFLVDVKKNSDKLPKPAQTQQLRQTLTLNPHEFHKKYTTNNDRNGDKV